MTTPAQARYIETLRDNRDHVDLDDDTVQANIDLIKQDLVREGETVDNEALYDWMQSLIDTHNRELECDLDELTTAEASALIDALKDGYHMALVGNLHQLAGYFMPTIIRELKAFVAERVADVEAQIERAEHIADGINAVDGDLLDELVEQAAAFYDAFQIEQALGVQGNCEDTIISKGREERLYSRLKEAKSQLGRRLSPQTAANVVRRVSTSLLAGDTERAMMRRYLSATLNAEEAMRTRYEGLSGAQSEALAQVVEADRRVSEAEEALTALKRERAEATRAALGSGVTQYKVAQATGRQQSAVAQWKRMK